LGGGVVGWGGGGGDVNVLDYKTRKEVKASLIAGNK